MTTRSVAIIQARLGSTRLPNKVLADIAGKPMLLRVVERARKIPKVTKVIVTIPACDMPLRAFCLANNIAMVVGDQADVLGRYHKAARVADADVVLRITGDCPLLDPALSAKVLRAFLRDEPIIADNRSPGADGFDTEVFSRATLDVAHACAKDDYEREHVTPKMYAMAGEYRTHVLVTPPGPKLSVDTAEDLARVRYIYDKLGRDIFSRGEALDALVGSYYR